MLQVTRTGVILGDPQQLASLAEQFARQHAVVLPDFLGADVIAFLQDRIAKARFDSRSDYDNTGQEYGRELTLDGSDISIHFLRLRLNNPRLFQTLQQITGCAPISAYSGRIYQWAANSGHFDDWHSDITPDGSNLLGLKINVGGPYDGGVFMLRRKSSQEILFEVSHKKAGDAHLFRISADLQHHLTPLEGTANRLVATGFFKRGVTLLDILRAAPAPKVIG